MIPIDAMEMGMAMLCNECGINESSGVKRGTPTSPRYGARPKPTLTEKPRR
jgi:hypothetical protein